MAGTKEDRVTVKTLIPRFFKALFKTAIVYIFFLIFSAFIAPFEGLIGHQALFTALVALYLFFVFVTEFARGTIFHHIFSIANSLMIVLYFAYVLNASVLNFTIEQFNLVVDLRFFLAIFVLGGMLGFARGILQLLNWMNEKEEQWLQYQIKSL